jgi:hypothetical protein
MPQSTSLCKSQGHSKYTLYMYIKQYLNDHCAYHSYCSSFRLDAIRGTSTSFADILIYAISGKFMIIENYLIEIFRYQSTLTHVMSFSNGYLEMFLCLFVAYSRLSIFSSYSAANCYLKMMDI